MLQRAGQLPPQLTCPYLPASDDSAPDKPWEVLLAYLSPGHCIQSQTKRDSVCYFKLHTHTALLGATRMENPQRGNDFRLTAKGAHIPPLTVHKHVSPPALDRLPVVILYGS